MTRRRHPIARSVVVLLAVATVSLVSVGPAAAHDVGSLLSNYETRLTSVTPDIDGIDVEVIEAGNRLQVENTTDTELVVLGYQDEPYLRIGPDGVFENLNAPATYTSDDREGGGELPERADPDAEPEWRKVSDDPIYRWHDHRIHWMSANDPPAVRERPDEEHVVIPGWVVPMTYGDETIEIVGDLVWVPSPSPAAWAVVILVVAALVAATGLLATWRPWSAIAVAALLVTSTLSALGIGFFGAGTTAERISESFADALYLPMLLVGGVVTIVLLARRHPFAPYLVIFTGTVGGLFGGVLRAGVLTNSVVPSAFDTAIARGLVAVTLGLGLGLLGAGIAAITRMPAATSPPTSTPTAEVV
jgi:hypothetical protein